MKTVSVIFLLLLFCLFVPKTNFGQGRVVINEFMPWSGCNTTNEFIELLNFGPGPMNIGCYIVTNGTYSVTIPPNTIIQPRQYYILSGQDMLAQNCGNTDSAVHVDLNWTSCNCTNVPIPTTGDGFMKNGGSSNEKIVLLDPDLNVLDAVSRNSPASSSVSITTPALSGGCTSNTFNLGTMGISYETIGISTGIDNSFARKVDGDCGWAKTTIISAHAPNKTGSTSSATYDFTTVSASDCQTTTGTISIQVTAPDVSSLFPMNYTLAFDADSNDTFNGSDTYTFGVDNTISAIDINNLAYGRYRITVGSSSSCNLKNFDFFIFNCYGVVLPLKLLSFTYKGVENNRQVFAYKLNDVQNLKEIALEGRGTGNFETVSIARNLLNNAEAVIQTPVLSYTFYRLRLKDQFDKVIYSPEVKVSDNKISSGRLWPNPVKDKIFVTLNSIGKGKINCVIFNATGVRIKELGMEVNTGNQTLSLPVGDLSNGIYHLRITGALLRQSSEYTFLK